MMAKAITKQGKRIRKVYNLIKEAENHSNVSLKIGLLGKKQIFKVVNETLGPDPLKCIVELAGTSFAKECDLLILAIDKPGQIIDELDFLKKNKLPVLVVVRKVNELNEDALDVIETVLPLDRLFFLNEHDFGKKIKKALISELPNKKLAIGRLLPGLRTGIADQIINATAKQNTWVAAVVFFPGADLPVLTVNQMKMIIELAAVYGQKLDLQRVKELMVTLGGGFIFRNIARQLLGVIPGPGFIIKAGVAYTGTKALGKLAKQYFTLQAADNR